MNIAEARRIASMCTFGDWTFRIASDGTGMYAQVRAETQCEQTGKPYFWGGRKWRLSKHMTKSEVVQTLFMACLVAVEHEARERFKYHGLSIFDPHYDVDQLWHLRNTSDSLDTRIER